MAALDKPSLLCEVLVLHGARGLALSPLMRTTQVLMYRIYAPVRYACPWPMPKPIPIPVPSSPCHQPNQHSELVAPHFFAQETRVSTYRVSNKKDLFRKHGEEGVNWKFMNEKDLFPQTSNHWTFGNPGAWQTRRVHYHQQEPWKTAQWPFVTPRFARWLLTHTIKRVSQQLIEFYFVVHDSARRLEQAIDAGHITLKRKILDQEEALERPEKRMKTAAASASLMSVAVDKVDGTGNTRICNPLPGTARCVERSDLW